MQQSRDRESAVSRKIPSWKKGQMTKMRNELNELRHDKMYSTSLSYLQLYNLTRTRTHNWQVSATPLLAALHGCSSCPSIKVVASCR